MSAPPITGDHLKQAVAMIFSALDAPMDTACGPRTYGQVREWDNGTVCGFHGLAHILARGSPATEGPAIDDYAGLPAYVRAGVISVMYSPGGTPDLLLRVIAGSIRIGANVHVGDGARVGDGATILYGASIGDKAYLGDGARVGNRSIVGHKAVIGEGATIGDYAIICPEATVGEGATVGDYAIICAEATVGQGATVNKGARVERA